MERLTGLDAAFLYFETPTHHLHVGALAVLDPSTMPDAYSFPAFQAYLGERLGGISTFRRRLVRVPFNLHHPLWIEDPSFDIHYHVRRVAVPAPGGPEELAEVADNILGHKLDRSRPLWEMWVCEGLRGGRIAIVTKIHHATIDGVSGANLMAHLFDLEPAPTTPRTPDEPHPESRPSDLELVAHALWSRLSMPRIVQAVSLVPCSLRAGWDVLQRARRPGEPSGAAPLTAPRTSLNATIGPRRSIAFVPVGLAEIKAVKNAFGATVNDVVLAVAAGALRRYLDSHDELPERPLVATCPVSVRGAEVDALPGSNKVSAMFVHLPTHLAEPVERLRAAHESTRGAKEVHSAIGARMLMDWSELAAPNTFAQAARFYSSLHLSDRHPVVYNLVVSNVPGPAFPLYLGGARLESLNMFGPIFDGAAVNLTVTSYRDEMSFGFIASTDVVPDLWSLANGVTESLDELVKAAAQGVTG